MILDDKLVLADGQAPTTVAVHDTESIIDFGAYGDPAYPMTLVVRVDTTVASSGAATVSFGLATSEDNSTYETLWTSGAQAKAALVAGTEIRIPVPTGMKRYCKGVITVAVAALTAGKFDIFMVPSAQTNVANV
nr:hypothetical protein [uncultured Dethiosulfovibrio sp.]